MSVETLEWVRGHGLVWDESMSSTATDLRKMNAL